jgi:hypothetical protein
MSQPKLAATILLCKPVRRIHPNYSDFKVLMVKRATKSRFAPGGGNIIVTLFVPICLTLGLVQKHLHFNTVLKKTGRFDKMITLNVLIIVML